ncbi:hypothetical protein [Gimesia algae]|uniref:Uncharacterized protein n=1 Tax=Gimesia algae TaxID=2527971 RepID=A0A517VN68_9PLAN|nr:hypothetical protein [Gimesia algae]QDT94456.1 hypothetical protein Pan161_61520 [Gimesia algae]
MHQSFQPQKMYQVRDAFEIKNEYPTAHAPGLVVVLDQRLHTEPLHLNGKQVQITTPEGHSFKLIISEAKDHLKATSIFFKDVNLAEISVGSQLSFEDPTVN